MPGIEHGMIVDIYRTRRPAPARAGVPLLTAPTVALALLAAPASAFTDSLTGCDAATLDGTERFLAGQGYVRVEDPSRLTPAQTTNAAWTLMPTYLDASGRRADRGGEDVATLLDLQRRAVPGLFRRVDTDAARLRLHVRGDDVITIAETVADGRTERSCRLALGAAATDVVSAGALDTGGHPDAPARGLYVSQSVLPEG